MVQDGERIDSTLLLLLFISNLKVFTNVIRPMLLH